MSAQQQAIRSKMKIQAMAQLTTIAARQKKNIHKPCSSYGLYMSHAEFCTNDLNVREIDFSGDASHTKSPVCVHYKAVYTSLASNTIRGTLLTVH